MSDTNKQSVAIPDSFASELIRARNKMGLSVSELHRKTSISRTVIQGYESGKYKPGTRELKLLCEALRITPNRLIFGTETPFEDKGKLAKLVGDEKSTYQTITLTILFQMLTAVEKEAFINLMQSILEGRVGKAKIDETLAAVDAMAGAMEDKAEGIGAAVDTVFPEEELEKIGHAVEEKLKRKQKAAKPKTSK